MPGSRDAIASKNNNIEEVGYYFPSDAKTDY